MTQPDSRPVRGPVSIESVPWREWSHGVRFGGRVRHLSQLFGDGYHVGVVIEELPPGKQSAPSPWRMPVPIAWAISSSYQRARTSMNGTVPARASLVKAA